MDFLGAPRLLVLALVMTSHIAADIFETIDEVTRQHTEPKEDKKEARPSKMSEEAMAAFPIDDKDRTAYVESLDKDAQEFFGEGKLEEALKLWQRIMIIDPKNVGNLGNVALTLKDLDKVTEARQVMAKALELHPDDPGTMHVL